MNNQEIKQILEKYKKWYNNEGGEQANLCGADLCGATLSQNPKGIKKGVF